jgi:hypothetical protein
LRVEKCRTHLAMSVSFFCAVKVSSSRTSSASTSSSSASDSVSSPEVVGSSGGASSSSSLCGSRMNQKRNKGVRKQASLGATEARLIPSRSRLLQRWRARDVGNVRPATCLTKKDATARVVQRKRTAVSPSMSSRFCDSPATSVITTSPPFCSSDPSNTTTSSGSGMSAFTKPPPSGCTKRDAYSYELPYKPTRVTGKTSPRVTDPLRRISRTRKPFRTLSRSSRNPSAPKRRRCLRRKASTSHTACTEAWRVVGLNTRGRLC